MQLKIIVRRANCRKHRTQRVVIDVESLNENLVDCCKKATDECYTIAFSKYYSNLDLMNFKRCFPYIIRGEKCIWKVPYDTVTIGEFFETHNITEEDSIYIDVDAFGGAGDFYDILTWVLTIWPMIEPYVAITGTTVGVIDLVLRCVKRFSKKAKEAPSSIDVGDFIRSKREWTIEELEQRSGLNDPIILELLLSHFGYEKKGYVFHYDEKLKIKQERQLSKSESECWGFYEASDEECDFVERICLINMHLTALELCSVMDNLDTFHEMEKKFDTLCEQYCCFTRGSEGLQYIEFNAEQLKEDEKDTIEMELDKIDELLFNYLDEYYSN